VSSTLTVWVVGSQPHATAWRAPRWSCSSTAASTGLPSQRSPPVPGSPPAPSTATSPTVPQRGHGAGARIVVESSGNLLLRGPTESGLAQRLHRPEHRRQTPRRLRSPTTTRPRNRSNGSSPPPTSPTYSNAWNSAWTVQQAPPNPERPKPLTNYRARPLSARYCSTATQTPTVRVGAILGSSSQTKAPPQWPCSSTKSRPVPELAAPVAGILSDNGPEFTGAAFTTQPGEPPRLVLREAPSL